MIARRRLARPSRPLSASVARYGPIVLPVVLAGLAVIGWTVDPLQLAILLAVELPVAGLGSAALLGPAIRATGYARYATVATATVAATLAGRLLPDGIGTLAAPVAWIFLWWALRTEIRGTTDAVGRLSLDLTLVLTVFAGASGIAVLFGPTQWLLRVGVLVLLVAIPALRAAEERGATGVQAVGQGALQLLAVTEIAIAITLLDLPQPVGPALVALGFHAWGGAADALLGGTPVRGVAIEFGSLALLGVLVALFLSQ